MRKNWAMKSCLVTFEKGGEKLGYPISTAAPPDEVMQHAFDKVDELKKDAEVSNIDVKTSY